MESRESKATKAKSFQFVTITKPGQGWKDKNEHIVRSHVMRQLRKKQRDQRQSKKRHMESYHVDRSGQRYD